MALRHLVLAMACLVSWSHLMHTSVVRAGGYMIPHQTARGLSMGDALTAGVTDPSAVYYNPAALSEVDGNAVLLNGGYINVISSVANSGRRSSNQNHHNFLASGFANYHIAGSHLTAGIGIYSPFGLATDFDGDFTRFAANQTGLKTLFVTPALSWHPSKYFSLGAGVSFVHASGLFSRSLCLDVVFGGPACSIPGAAEGHVRVTDTANAFTYNIGLLVKPQDNLKFGLSYHARTDVRFDSADVKLAGVVGPTTTRAKIRPIPLPSVIKIGAFWKINPHWGTEILYEHTRWSEFKNVTAVFLGGPLPGFSLPQDWKNTSTVCLGSYYTLNNNWEIRGGLALDESPIPSKTLNPSIPDADKLTLSAGVGYTWNRLSIDVGYMAVFYKTRHLANGELEGIAATGIPFLGAPGRDKHKTFDNFVALSITYRFPSAKPSLHAVSENTRPAYHFRPGNEVDAPAAGQNASLENIEHRAKQRVRRE